MPVRDSVGAGFMFQQGSDVQKALFLREFSLGQ